MFATDGRVELVAAADVDAARAEAFAKSHGIAKSFGSLEAMLDWGKFDAVSNVTPDAAHIPSGCRFHPRCPLAFDRCKVEEPPLFDVGGGQKAACWLVEGGRSLPVVAAPAPARAPVPASEPPPAPADTGG